MNGGELLIGNRTYKLDGKGRFPITSFKPEKGEKLVLVHGEDDCVDIYSYSYIEKLVKESMDDEEVQDLMDYLSVNAIGTAIADGQHRVKIPDNIMTEYQLKKEVVVLGRLNRLSVFNRSSYNSFANRLKNKPKVLIR